MLKSIHAGDFANRTERRKSGAFYSSRADFVSSNSEGNRIERVACRSPRISDRSPDWQSAHCRPFFGRLSGFCRSAYDSRVGLYPEARVDPRVGGEYVFSWGPGMEGKTTIAAWEPGTHFGTCSERSITNGKGRVDTGVVQKCASITT